MGHPPPHPQLLNKKECSSIKVVIVKKSQNVPLDPSSAKDWPGGQWEHGHGVVLHDLGEV